MLPTEGNKLFVSKKEYCIDERNGLLIYEGFDLAICEDLQGVMFRDGVKQYSVVARIEHLIDGEPLNNIERLKLLINQLNEIYYKATTDQMG